MVSGDSLATSTVYPAARSSGSMGSLVANRIALRKCLPPGVQWTPGDSPARMLTVPEGLTVVTLIDSRIPSHSE